jgi:hypothetical protein
MTRDVPRALTRSHGDPIPGGAVFAIAVTTEAVPTRGCSEFVLIDQMMVGLWVAPQSWDSGQYCCESKCDPETELSTHLDCLVTCMANNLNNLIPRGRAVFRQVLLEPRSFCFP